MQPLIAIIGNSGVGKSTLVRALARNGYFYTGLEAHARHPFHRRVAAGAAHLALANQFDFLLHRAEQETALRQGPAPALVDGGLELDYWGFTHLFHRRRLLDGDEMALCRRLYRLIRRHQPAPELFVYLQAPPAAIDNRYAKRGRAEEVTRRGDLAVLHELIEAWLGGMDRPVIPVDAAEDSYLTPAGLEELRREIGRRLGK